jgi:hypothetical protein
MSQVKYYRKRYLELLKLLSNEKKPDESYEHVLDQLEGVERELYRLGQHEWMEKAAKKYIRINSL